MLGWGVAVGMLGGGNALVWDVGRILKRDFLGIFGMGDGQGALEEQCVGMRDGVVCIWGRRCLKQDFRGFSGDAHGIKEKIGWKDWQDD